MNKDVEEKSIGEKKIYIFEKHQYALFPWAEVKRGCSDCELMLFTLDYHTDTHEPFLYHCKGNEQEAKHLIEKIRIDDPNSIKAAIQLLRNDEHIKTALRVGIFQKAFIISYSNLTEVPVSIQEKERMEKWKNGDPEYLMKCIEGDYGITPIRDRTYEPSDIYIPPFVPEGVYEYGSEYDDDVLEDSFLLEKMKILSQMCTDVISEDGMIRNRYILDIDLDYFRTKQSIAPLSRQIFANLVKHAEAITIAKESDCVEMVRSDKDVTSTLLLEKLLVLLNEIISNET